MSKQKVSTLVLLLTSISGYSSMVDDCEIYKSDSNTIDCTNRNLTYIPIDEINQLNAIVLNFGNNCLKFSSDDVATLSEYPYRMTVVEIRLNDNCIENMPYLSDALPNLMKIDLRYNNIKSIKKSQFLRFRNLKTVCLNNNPLEATEFEHLKTMLPHVNFACPGNINNN